MKINLGRYTRARFFLGVCRHPTPVFCCAIILRDENRMVNQWVTTGNERLLRAIMLRGERLLREI